MVYNLTTRFEFKKILRMSGYLADEANQAGDFPRVRTAPSFRNTVAVAISLSW